jgi:hypothetical protein
MSIHQIVYTSEAVVVFDRLRLVSLLNKARSHNMKKSITGVLLHSSGLFVQCLEGEAGDVEALYQRISADRRHENLVILQRMDLRKRNFSGWAMGCIEVHDSELLALQNAQWQAAVGDYEQREWLSPGFVLIKSLWDFHRLSPA